MLADSAGLAAHLDQAAAIWRDEMAKLGADLDDPVVAHAVLAGLDVFRRVLATPAATGAICPASWVAVTAAHNGVIATLLDHIPEEARRG